MVTDEDNLQLCLWKAWRQLQLVLVRPTTFAVINKKYLLSARALSQLFHLGLTINGDLPYLTVEGEIVKYRVWKTAFSASLRSVQIEVWFGSYLKTFSWHSASNKLEFLQKMQRILKEELYLIQNHLHILFKGQCVIIFSK